MLAPLRRWPAADRHSCSYASGAVSLTNASTLGRFRRQTGQIEAGTAGQRAAIGLGRRLQPDRFQPRQNETVDRISHPRLVLHRGQRRAHRRDERPVRLILGAGRDPFASAVLSAPAVSVLCERRRRHHVIGIGAVIRLTSSLSAGLPGDDRAHLDGGFAAVEPQVGLAQSAIRTVAGEAILGQDRPDVAVVADRAVGLGRAGL